MFSIFGTLIQKIENVKVKTQIFLMHRNIVDVDPESGSKKKSPLLVNFIFPFLFDTNQIEIKDERCCCWSRSVSFLSLLFTTYGIFFLVINDLVCLFSRQ